MSRTYHYLLSANSRFSTYSCGPDGSVRIQKLVIGEPLEEPILVNVVPSLNLAGAPADALFLQILVRTFAQEVVSTTLDLEVQKTSDPETHYVSHMVPPHPVHVRVYV